MSCDGFLIQFKVRVMTRVEKAHQSTSFTPRTSLNRISGRNNIQVCGNTSWFRDLFLVSMHAAPGRAPRVCLIVCL
jgi:hypothetical protein